MSLTLNMVGGGSGGGISPNDALLVVYTPLGSSVTATNGTATKTSNTGIALSDRPTVEIHLFSIGSSQFGTWTVTATRDTETNSTTISVAAVERYELYIDYHVPVGYREVEYIESSGTQGLNLNLDIQSGFIYKIITRPLQSRTANTVIGSYDDTNILAFNNNRYVSYVKSGTSPAFSTNMMNPNTYDAVVEGTFGTSTYSVTALINGVTYNSSVGTGTPSSYSGCYLFTNLRGAHGNHRVYYFEIKNGQTPLRELYPCYRISDSVAGMYDKINDVFYTNTGSGTFIVGADVL